MSNMDESTRIFVEQIPEKPPRSKLEPYADVIRDLRRKRRTYQEIARFFADHFQLPVAPSTIHAFVKVRARRRHQLQIELPPEAPSRTQKNEHADAVLASASEVQDRINALRRRAPTASGNERVFEYNEDEQLRLNSPVKTRRGD
jgi:hypothetical protein